MAELRNITEGMTGQESADVVYTNDESLNTDIIQVSADTEFIKKSDLLEGQALQAGAYSKNGGVFFESSEYYSSNFIAVSPGDNIRYVGKASENVLILAAFTTNSGNAAVNQSIIGKSASLESGIYTVPDGINFVKLCTVLSVPYSLSKYDDFYEGIDQNTLDINSSATTLYGSVKDSYSSEILTKDGVYLSSTGAFAETNAYKASEFIKVKEGDTLEIFSRGSSSSLLVVARNNGSTILNKSLQGDGVLNTKYYVVEEGISEIAFSCDITNYQKFGVNLRNKGILDETDKTNKNNLLAVNSDEYDTFENHGTFLVSTLSFAATESYRCTNRIPVKEGDIINYKNLTGSSAVFTLSLFESIDSKVNADSSIKGTGFSVSGSIQIPRGINFAAVCCDINNYTSAAFSVVTSKAIEKQSIFEDNVETTDYKLYGTTGDLFPNNAAYSIINGYEENSLYMSSLIIVVSEGQRYRYALNTSESYYVIAALTDDRTKTVAPECSVPGKGAYSQVQGEYVVPKGIKYLVFTNTVAGDTINSKTGYLIVREELKNQIRNGSDNLTFIVKDMGDMSFASSVTTNSDGSKNIVNNGFGQGGQIDARTVEFVFKVDAKLRITEYDSSGNFFVVVGKYEALAGTLLGVRKTDNSYTLGVYLVNDGGGIRTIISTPIQAIPLNTDIRLTMKKIVDTWYFSLVTSTGDWYEFKAFQYFFGNGWGYPSHYSIQGRYTIYDFNFSVQENKSPKILLFGDSYTEGSTFRGCKFNLYSELLAKEIGRRDLINLGKGGESAERIIHRIKQQMDYYQGAKYCILNIGVNDTNMDTYKSRMTEYIAYAKQLGMIPVLCTIPVRYDKGNQWAVNVINPWVKEQGEPYIDVYAALTDGNGNVPANLMLADNIHPTLEGHRRIFNRFRLDAPYLF